MATTRIVYIHALSPIHAGTGQSLGAVDLAIARERATGMPFLPGSSIKGALRDKARGVIKDDEVKLFGPDTENASDHAGTLVFGDANLLLLPVRSIAGTFAWVTSPYLVHRFLRDAQEAGLALGIDGSKLAVDKAKVGVAGPESILTVADKGSSKKVYFEDLDFDAADNAELGKLAATVERALALAELRKRLCLVHDDVMSFLCQHAMDVATRVSLDPETKTAKDGQLWTEENLPTEAVLTAVVVAMPNARAAVAPEAAFAKLGQLFESSVQLGGKATVGRGRCRLAFGVKAGK